MKVKNLFINIDRDKLGELAEDDPYWERSERFVSQVWEKPVNDLSQKQMDWLDSIDTKMAEICGQ